MMKGVAHAGAMPKISIIIDDLGNHLDEDNRVTRLPGPVTCSILPRTFLSLSIAEQCHAQHKTVMLHAPMQAIRPHRLGFGGLTIAMDEQQFTSVLLKDIDAIPYVAGVNNHMGSLLTQCTAAMRWLMKAIKLKNLFFVDSLTSDNSVASSIAKDFGVPTIKRDIFLDNIANYEQIDAQFQALISIARRKGRAVAIGHPYPATIAYLEQNLPKLAEKGIQLVSIVELVNNS